MERGSRRFSNAWEEFSPCHPTRFSAKVKTSHRLRAAERSRLVCYVAQEQILSLNYSVLDIVLMGRASFISAFSVPSREDRIKAREALGYVGMSVFESRLFSELSSGERRLVLIARTLAQEPGILLLDEPTTFLDPKHEIEVMELCRRLAVERGKTVIATMHNLDMAVKYADFLVFMKKGRIAASGTPEAVLEEDLLENVYEIPMKIIKYEGRILILR